MLDLSQKKFSETLTGQPDYLSGSLDHGATGTEKKTRCFKIALLLEPMVIFKQIDP